MLPRTSRFLSWFLLFLCYTSVGYAQQNFLKEIKAYPANAKGEIQIDFSFQDLFTETPQTNYGAGWVKITFPNTRVAGSEKTKKIQDGIIDNIRSSSEGKSSIIEIAFRDLDFIARNRVVFPTQRAKTFIAKINTKAPIIVKKTKINKDTLFPKKEKKEYLLKDSLGINVPINNQTETNDDSYTKSLVKMLIALLLVLGVIYGILWVYNKFFAGKLGIKNKDHQINVSSTYHISPKQKVIILDVNGTPYACGVTPSSINLISKVNVEEEGTLLRYFGSKIDLASLAGIRAEYQQAKKVKLDLEEKEDSSSAEDSKSKKGEVNKPSKFADELIKKTKKLKKID
ncbi:MAG: flagellar biogenesis protein FliO [bacterium]|jgi:flagellar biogenesis protein FliO